MRIKFIRVDEGDRKKLALNLAKLSQKRTEKGSRAGDLLARMGTHKFNPEGASTGPLKAPIHGGDEDKAKRLTKRASFFREKGLSTPGQADPGTAKERTAALRAGRASGDARRFWRQNASTELFGNKIVEGFNRLLNELKTPTGGIPRDESGKVKKGAGKTVAAGILATARTGKVPDKPLSVSDKGEVDVGDSESRKNWKEATPEERTKAGKITSKPRHEKHFGKGKLRLPPRPPKK